MARLLLLAIIFFNILASAAARTITDINQLDTREMKVVNWVKKYTVPNTRDGNGNPWDAKSLPQKLLSWSGYKDSAKIKPAAWAAALVSAWSISEGIFHCGDFYRAPKVPEGTKNGLIDVRCDACFVYPAQLPPKTDFPIEVFTYNLCQGKAGNPDPKTETYGKICNCASTKYPGKLIGPNQNCYGRRDGESDWQNGMWGMEQSHVGNYGGAKGMATRAEKIYTAVKGTRYTYRDVLAGTLTQSGFPKGTKVYGNVMQCVPVNPKTGNPPAAGDLSWTCADLVSMWLTRNHLVGLTVALHDNDNWKFEERLPTIKALATYYNN